MKHYIKLKIYCIVLGVFCFFSVALGQDKYKVLIESPRTDKEKAEIVIGSVFKAIQNGQPELLLKSLLPGAKKVLPAQSTFLNNSKGNSITHLNMKSFSVELGGEQATAVCKMNLSGTDTSFTLILKKQPDGNWSIAGVDGVWKNTADLITISSNRKELRKTANTKTKSMNITGYRDGIPLYERIDTRHALIPYQSDGQWKITKSYVESRIGKSLFSTPRDAAYVPLQQNGDGTCNGTVFVLDDSWKRILYSKEGTSSTYSYDVSSPKGFQFINPNGIKAMRLQSGETALFVPDDAHGIVAQFSYNSSTNQISFVNRIGEGILQSPTEVSVNPYDVYYNSNNFMVWVSDPLAGKIIGFNSSGAKVCELDRYTFNGNTNYINRIQSFTTNTYQSGTDIGLIDKQRNAFVLVRYANNTFTTVNASGLSSYARFSSVDKLAGQWYATDLFGYFHIFDQNGEYIASYSKFDDSFAQVQNSFSGADGVNLFTQPVAFPSAYNQLNGYPAEIINRTCIDIWNENYGITRYLWGADIVQTGPILKSEYSIEIPCVFTNQCYFSQELRNPDGSINPDYTWSNVWMLPGNWGSVVSTDDLLRPGTHRLILKTAVAENSRYPIELRQNPVELSIDVWAPLSVNWVTGSDLLMRWCTEPYSLSYTGGSSNATIQWWECYGDYSKLVTTNCNTYNFTMPDVSGVTLKVRITDIDGTTDEKTKFVTNDNFPSFNPPYEILATQNLLWGVYLTWSGGCGGNFAGYPPIPLYISQYKIYRKPLNGGSFSLLTTLNVNPDNLSYSFNDYGAARNTYYQYYVTVVNTAGEESDPSPICVGYRPSRWEE
jgi:hypothetical protein